MLFYGDRNRTEDARAKLDGIAHALRDAAAMPGGIARHGALVAAFIEAGELVQGVADAAFAARGGRDARSPAEDAAMLLATRLAAAVRLSWESGFARFDPAPVEAALGPAAVPPEMLRTKAAEGFAFYALYPEAYLAAARAAGLPPGERVKVIGIRSIGVPLGALVAAGAGAPPPVTLRPVGHPFRRELSLSEELEAELIADPASVFAVADEGPGLSGSSFGAVADFLEDRGVPPSRIHFFPSHGGGPGPRANPRHRARWATAHRHLIEFDALVKHRLASWVEDLVGAQEGPLEEVSGGGWRRLRYRREADWPPVNAQMERRKFLLRAGDRVWLLKFAGLGREGERKLERARALHAAGFAPAVAGFRHGFLIEEWIGHAHPLQRGGHDAARLAERIGRYLGFRARHFPAGAGQGAPLAALRHMARHNAAEGMGESWARRLEERTAGLEGFEPRLRRIETDNRLHAWEWLALPDGRLLKADALDHHAAHDLVGCQDVAWDVAGALCEFGLEGGERDALLAAVEREAARRVDPGLVHALAPCYLAFQLGACFVAAEVAAPDEGARLRAEAGRYAALLRRALGGGAERLG